MKKLSEVTDQEWESFNKWNRNIVEKFLKNRQSQLSPQTLKQYTSGLRHWLRWIHNEIGEDMEIHKLKVRHGEEYITYLYEAGLSPAAIRFKTACASSLCKYLIRNYGDDEFPRFKNIFEGTEKPPKASVHTKEPLTPDEYQNLIDALLKRGEYQMVAYLKFSYSSGCRRAEARQLLREVAGYERVKSPKTGDVKSYYRTHTIRAKGRGKSGKQRTLNFDEDAMNAIKKWLEVRGEDDCPYVFVVKTSTGKVHQVGETAFNYWCKSVFTDIVGRRVHPHMIRSSKATNASVYEGKSIDSIKNLLGHNDISTTQIYIVKNDDDTLDELFDE